MSLTGNNKQTGKSAKNTPKNTAQGSKFFNKPGKPVGMTKKPVKTGGTRGS